MLLIGILKGNLQSFTNSLTYHFEQHTLLLRVIVGSSAIWTPLQNIILKMVRVHYNEASVLITFESHVMLRQCCKSKFTLALQFLFHQS